jgi:DNA-binding CsgD family transcriptional regulator
MMDNSAQYWAQTSQFIAQVQEIGDEIGMPYIAVQADLADPNPMSDEHGVPYALSTFRWINPSSQYYRDRKLALNQPFLNACRLTAEPFYFSGGAFHMNRFSQMLSSIDCTHIDESFLTAETIIVPVHQPRSVLGAILWCAKEPVGVADIFHQHAGRLHYLALQLLSAHNEALGRPSKAPVLQRLTRREAQCLRWAAAGKTDSEIGIILDLSISTVRFHLRNAASKLGATGRTQTIQMAAGLGFIGAI